MQLNGRRPSPASDKKLTGLVNFATYYFLDQTAKLHFFDIEAENQRSLDQSLCGTGVALYKDALKCQLLKIVIGRIIWLKRKHHRRKQQPQHLPDLLWVRSLIY